MTESLTTTLSFFGRIADALSREPASYQDLQVHLDAPPREALYKPGGFFAFAGLKTSPDKYRFRLESTLYQRRSFEESLPGAAPVELALAGEDEIYLVVKSVIVGSKNVKFDAIPMMPLAPRGAPVLGAGGFSATLAADLVGVDVSSAALDSVSGLAPGALLRVIRSRSLLAKPGPYYPFPPATTVLKVKIVEDAADGRPLEGARAKVLELDGVAPASTNVGGVSLRHVTLPGPPARHVVIGPDGDLETLTNPRGHAALFLPGHWTLSSLRIEFSHAKHLSVTSSLSVQAGETTTATVKLVPI